MQNRRRTEGADGSWNCQQKERRVTILLDSCLARKAAPKASMMRAHAAPRPLCRPVRELAGASVRLDWELAGHGRGQLSSTNHQHGCIVVSSHM
jgi:hypothetical protein